MMARGMIRLRLLCHHHTILLTTRCASTVFSIFSARSMTRLRLHSHHHTRPVTTRSASTVFALSSGQGKCGVAVVRVTGSQVRDVFSHMTKPSTIPSPRVATLRHIVHPTTGEALDRGLVLWFRDLTASLGRTAVNYTYMGEWRLLLRCCQHLVPSLDTLLHNQKLPGDFTRRAFHHGKLDLTAVEGLGDLIHAETEAQRKQALRQMKGALGQLYGGWRTTLLHCRAALEAYIDFSEDDNIEAGVVADVESKIKELVTAIEHHLADGRRGERLRSGLQLAILGRPNVGKSSFLNTLVQRPAAIVSPVPGTTRDIVETVVDLGGYPVVVSDTAGLRTTGDVVEKEGVRRALARAHQADVVVVVLEASEVLQAVKLQGFKWDCFLQTHLTNLGILDIETECKGTEGDGLASRPQWINNNSYVTLVNKIDVVTNNCDKDLLISAVGESTVLMSLKTLEGFDLSLQMLQGHCASLCNVEMAENPTLTAARHRTHISACLNALQNILYPDEMLFSSGDSEKQVQCSKNDVKANWNPHDPIASSKFSVHVNDRNIINRSMEGTVSLLQNEETILEAAHHLQRAANSLGHVTGHITTEDVLNQIFSAFCIGK